MPCMGFLPSKISSEIAPNVADELVKFDAILSSAYALSFIQHSHTCNRFI